MPLPFSISDLPMVKPPPLATILTLRSSDCQYQPTVCAADVRGKLNKPVEFGAKLSASLTGEGIARVDHLRWEAFHEGGDLKAQVEAYREFYGHYPEVVLGDPIYGTRENRRHLKQLGIRFAGKPLGRPKKVTDANCEELLQ